VHVAVHGAACKKSSSNWQLFFLLGGLATSIAQTKEVGSLLLKKSELSCL